MKKFIVMVLGCVLLTSCFSKNIDSKAEKSISVTKVKEICMGLKKGMSKEDFLSQGWNPKLSSTTFETEDYIIGDSGIALCSVIFKDNKLYQKVYVANN